MRLACHLAWLLFGAAVRVAAHVPTYGVGVDNCFTPPHHHDTSQVIYLKGSGGLEIHYKGDKEPFDFSGEIDFDVVFKEKYDPTTYEIYVGCGGCVATLDPIVIPRTLHDGYQHASVEPFTQVWTATILAFVGTTYATAAYADPLLQRVQEGQPPQV